MLRLTMTTQVVALYPENFNKSSALAHMYNTSPMLVYFNLWFIRCALLLATSLNSLGCHPLGFREFALAIIVTNKTNL